MKYRKKPVIVEAFQLTEKAVLDHLIDEKPLEIPVTLTGACNAKKRTLSTDWVIVKTEDGNMRADIGDWITKDEAGKIDRIKADLFAAAYEPAE